jgi:hypothetical protein
MGRPGLVYLTFFVWLVSMEEAGTRLLKGMIEKTELTESAVQDFVVAVLDQWTHGAKKRNKSTPMTDPRIMNGLRGCAFLSYLMKKEASVYTRMLFHLLSLRTQLLRIAWAVREKDATDSKRVAVAWQVIRAQQMADEYEKARVELKRSDLRHASVRAAKRHRLTLCTRFLGPAYRVLGDAQRQSVPRAIFCYDNAIEILTVHARWRTVATPDDDKEDEQEDEDEDGGGGGEEDAKEKEARSHRRYWKRDLAFWGKDVFDIERAQQYRASLVEMNDRVLGHDLQRTRVVLAPPADADLVQPALNALNEVLSEHENDSKDETV